jgi:leucyl aminopeptidase
MIIDARLPVRLRLLIPAVENSVSGDAYRPGDVLPSRKGLTVEIGNTDAEGRLVLADALAEADADAPDLLIDLATLTGAARVALGPELPALFGNDPDLVDAVLRHGREQHDPLWPMPLWSPYEEELASKVADLGNVAPSSFAGAVFGALFLKRFVSERTPWLHIDLFAWNPRERPGRPVGAEVQCARALFALLDERYPARA